MSIRSPQAHLYWPLPLVAELGEPLVSGLLGSDGAIRQDPTNLALCRAAWDLLRLQRRFKGRVLLVSSAPWEDALWVAHQIGFDRSLAPMITPGDTAGLRRLVAEHLGGGAFDVIGGAQIAASLGVLARRMWLIGEDDTLRRQMLTRGVQMLSLDSEDRFAIADLAVARSAEINWSLPAEEESIAAPAPVRRGAS